jgi:hypothetical protein
MVGNSRFKKHFNTEVAEVNESQIFRNPVTP